MIEMLAVALLLLALYSLRGWFKAARMNDAARGALEYAHDLQHDVVELYQAAFEMRLLVDKAREEELYNRLQAAVAEFRATRERRIVEYGFGDKEAS